MVAVDVVRIELKVEFVGKVGVLRLVVMVIVVSAFVVNLTCELLLSLCCLKLILATMLCLVIFE